MEESQAPFSSEDNHSNWQNLEVVPTYLPLVEEVHFQHHPIRYRTYRNRVAAFWWAFPVITLTVFALVFPGLWVLIPIGILLPLIVLSFVGINRGYKKRSYALRERDLTYKKGWLFFSTTTIPFNRIQHTEVSQGPYERRFKLCTLKIYTAGGSTSDLSIPGLEAEEAQQLRDYISKKAAIYA